MATSEGEGASAGSPAPGAVSSTPPQFPTSCDGQAGAARIPSSSVRCWTWQTTAVPPPDPPTTSTAARVIIALSRPAIPAGSTALSVPSRILHRIHRSRPLVVRALAAICTNTACHNNKASPSVPFREILRVTSEPAAFCHSAHRPPTSLLPSAILSVPCHVPSPTLLSRGISRAHKRLPTRPTAGPLVGPATQARTGCRGRHRVSSGGLGLRDVLSSS
jgi:hypothetical protein